MFPKISVGASLETQSVLTSRHGPEGITSVKVTCFSPMSRAVADVEEEYQKAGGLNGYIPALGFG